MKHQGFIDWMKACGMLFIIIGHVIGSPFHIFNMASQPIYTKQLGVCFFIFIMGWSLANEHKRDFKVVFNRVFPVYFYGIAIALIISSILIFIKNDINESNYLPFFLGINVLFNNFPANPTTWYIGTYLHLLLFWFFLIQGKNINAKHILFAFICEVVIRCCIIYLDKAFIAYMLLPNWLTVFLLGNYMHNKKDQCWQPKTIAMLVTWLIVMLLWISPFNQLTFDTSFPFRIITSDEPWALPLRSFLISLIYLASTLIVFELCRCLPKLNIIAFFARNSLLTFIIHMPIIYAFSSDFYSLFDDNLTGRWFFIFILYIGLALISEFIQKQVNIKLYQDKAWNIACTLHRYLLKPNKH